MSLAPPETDVRWLAGRARAEPALAAAWESLVVPAGAVLFAAGDPGDCLYVVTAGEVEIVTSGEAGQRIVLERIGPGQCFGELALVDGGRRAAGAEALTELRLDRLRRAAFLSALETSPALGRALVDVLGARLRRSATYVEHLTRWARQVALGDYQGARAEIEPEGLAADDPQVERFVRTFLDTVDAVQAREAELRRELAQLRIEIDATKFARQVAEVTESDFFQSLQSNARQMRRRLHGDAAPR